VINFEETAGKMEAADLKETLEATEDTVKRQKFRKEETNVEDIGSLGDRYDDQRFRETVVPEEFDAAQVTII
jgi:hypothetical protein